MLLAAALLSPGALTAPDPRFGRLFEWLSVNGATIGPIELRKSAVGPGNGAFTTKAVAQDEELLSLPLNLCVGLRQAVRDDDVGEQLARLCERGQGGATVALAGFLAKEWLCEKEDGAFGPYLAMLPWDADWPPEGEQEQEHILWWSEAQIDSLFGSEVRARARARACGAAP
eukprot:4358876-Prymnesium_polylepis.2